MVVKKKHIEDVKKIMSFDEEMIQLLPKLEDDLNSLNPWVKQLPEIFCSLKLKKNQVILDIPCGKGGVSVPLAKKYGVKILGYDIVETYIHIAKKLAEKQKVSHLCTFKIEDVRKTIKRKDICNILLWIAPPHLWKNCKETIKALRNCVKHNGIILIADAYVYKPTRKYEDYETLDSTSKGYTNSGDKLLRFIDYKKKLWREDYARCRKSAKETLKKMKNNKDKTVIKNYLKSLNQEEKTDIKHLGLGIWIIQINKN